MDLVYMLQDYRFFYYLFLFLDQSYKHMLVN